MNESLRSPASNPDQLMLFAGKGVVAHELVGADDRTRARLTAHEVNTDIYNLTGAITPEQQAIAEQGRLSSGYQEVQSAVSESLKQSVGDEKVAAAILAARAAKAARATRSTDVTLASPTRKQVQ